MCQTPDSKWKPSVIKWKEMGPPLKWLGLVSPESLDWLRLLYCILEVGLENKRQWLSEVF